MGDDSFAYAGTTGKSWCRAHQCREDAMITAARPHPSPGGGVGSSVDSGGLRTRRRACPIDIVSLSTYDGGAKREQSTARMKSRVSSVVYCTF